MNGLEICQRTLFRQDAQAVAFPTSWDNMPGRKRAEMGRNAQWKFTHLTVVITVHVVIITINPSYSATLCIYKKIYVYMYIYIDIIIYI